MLDFVLLSPLISCYKCSTTKGESNEDKYSSQLKSCVMPSHSLGTYQIIGRRGALSKLVRGCTW